MMICKECLPLLGLYLDDELEERTTDLVNSHMLACPSCADEYSKLRREQNLYLSYEFDAHTSPSFWDGVMARVAEEKIPRSVAVSLDLRHRLSALFSVFDAPRLSLTSVSVILLAAIGLIIGVLKFTGSVRETPDFAFTISSGGAAAPSFSASSDSASPSVNEEKSALFEGNKGDVYAEKKDAKWRQPGGNRERHERSDRVMLATRMEVATRSSLKPVIRRESTIDELVRDAEQKYVAAIRLLSQDASRHRSQLDSETAAQFKQTLVSINRTIAGTRRAVREHPGDPVAVQYMLTAYAKKVEVLREIVKYRSEDE